MARHVSRGRAVFAGLVLAASVARAQSATAARVGPSSAADSAAVRARGEQDGRAAASTRSTRGSFAGGIASGLLSAGWGLFISYPIASRTVVLDSAAVRAMADSTALYASTFRAAYGREHKAARRSATVKGFLIGSVPWIVLMIALSGG